MSFEIVTVIVVLAIFSLFFYGVYLAVKVVAAEAKLKREAQASKTVGKTRKK